MLDTEYSFYKKNMADFNTKYADRFIVIKDETIIGDFETIELAMEEGLRQFEPGTFLVKQCIPEDDQIMRFHSRVSFSQNAQYI